MLVSYQITADDFEEVVLQEVMSQTANFQKAVYKGKLTDSMDVLDYLMDQPNIMPRLNDRVLNRERSFYLDMSGKATSTNRLEVFVQLFSKTP